LQIILNSSWFVVLAEEDHSNLQPEPAPTGFVSGWMEFFGWTAGREGQKKETEAALLHNSNHLADFGLCM
jgi:hypothetical protein